MDQYQKEQLEAAAKAAELDASETAQLMDENDPTFAYRHMFKVFFPHLNWDACIVCHAFLPISEDLIKGHITYAIASDDSILPFCYDDLSALLMKSVIKENQQ